VFFILVRSSLNFIILSICVHLTPVSFPHLGQFWRISNDNKKGGPQSTFSFCLLSFLSSTLPLFQSWSSGSGDEKDEGQTYFCLLWGTPLITGSCLPRLPGTHFRFYSSVHLPKTPYFSNLPQLLLSITLTSFLGSRFFKIIRENLPSTKTICPKENTKFLLG
jgi:hypothetical protein